MRGGERDQQMMQEPFLFAYWYIMAYLIYNKFIIVWTSISKIYNEIYCTASFKNVCHDVTSQATSINQTLLCDRWKTEMGAKLCLMQTAAKFPLEKLCGCVVVTVGASLTVGGAPWGLLSISLSLSFQALNVSCPPAPLSPVDRKEKKSFNNRLDQ